MDLSTQTQDSLVTQTKYDLTSLDKNLTIIEEQIRQSFGSVVYTHKTHEKCADYLTRRLNYLKTFQVILSALTTTSLLIAVLGDTKIGTVLGAVLSTLLFGLTLYTKELSIGKSVQQHIDTAKKLWSIRESYVSLLTDLATGHTSFTGAMEQRDSLQNQVEAVYKSAPRTDDTGYSLAQNALQKNEDYTFSAKELNAFLPASLHRGK